MRVGLRAIIRYIVLGSFFTLLLPVACSRQNLDISKLQFESTPVISSSEMWGVVKERYLPVPAQRDTDANIVITLRKGDIVNILRSERIDDLIWCEIKFIPAGGDPIKGWVLENVFTVYDSLLKAREGSKDITGN